MNNETRLMELSERLRAERPKATDSTARLTAWARMYIALFRLVTVTGRDADFGDRRMWMGLGDLLFLLLLDRAGRTASVGEGAELISAAFRLAGEVTFSYDAKRENACREAVINLLASHEQELSNPLALRCLTDYFYPLTETDEADPWLIALRKSIRQWAESFSEREGWRGVALDEALLRLEVMGRNSSLLLDDTYDATLQKAYAYYRAAIHIYNMPLPALLRLYDLALREGAFPPDEATAFGIATMACGRRASHVLSADGDPLVGLSLEVDALCEMNYN